MLSSLHLSSPAVALSISHLPLCCLLWTFIRNLFAFTWSSAAFSLSIYGCNLFRLTLCIQLSLWCVGLSMLCSLQTFFSSSSTFFTSFYASLWQAWNAFVSLFAVIFIFLVIHDGTGVLRWWNWNRQKPVLEGISHTIHGGNVTSWKEQHTTHCVSSLPQTSKRLNQQPMCMCLNCSWATSPTEWRLPFGFPQAFRADHELLI